MVAGESLLKIIDYPFAYSIVTVIGAIIGFSITANKIFLLGIAGALGTFLSIVDPLGWAVRNNLKDKLPIKKPMVNYPITESDLFGEESILKSRAITIETDKIISMIYFAITSGIFLIGIIFSPFLAENFIIHDKSNKVVCDSNCVKITTGIGSSFVCIVLGIVGIRRWSELTEKISIAIMHQRAISNEFVITNSLENMTRSLEQNDWVTAGKWGEKIEKEIENKQGKRDLIIQTTENVYEPLYKEFLRLDGVSQQIELQKQYFPLGFGAWGAIKERLLHLSITDGEFVKLADSFQKLANRYEYLINSAESVASLVITGHLSSTYNENVVNAVFTVGGPTWKGDVKLDDLSKSAIFGGEPNFAFGKTAIPQSLTLTIKDQSGNDSKKIITPPDLDKFINDWGLIVEEVKYQDSVKELEASYLKILEEIKTLKDKCEKQNKLKYKVF